MVKDGEDEQRETSERSSCVIIGGGGFVGKRLAERCAERGYRSVLCLDVLFGEALSQTNVHQVVCDLADPSSASLLERTFHTAHTVFLLASYGMSGADQLNTDKIRAVNVDGTRRVVEACRTAGVPSLVYCSTYNAVFVGEKIEGLGEHEIDYPTDDMWVDEYSRTKSMAERMVLDANNGDRLRTCCIRPAAIWGFGEERHFARVVQVIDAGLFCFRFGGSPIVDFVHVSNLVQAFLLAGLRLEKRDEAVAGQVFFVSDGRPQDNFWFFSQLKAAKGRGGMETLWRVPYRVVYLMAVIFELLHRLVGMRWRPWMLTRAEVMKAGVTHYVSIDRARRHLGYEPQLFSFGEVIEQWVESRKKKLD
jgi:nucleoside-diphosphate-sugar epimerase